MSLRRGAVTLVVLMAILLSSVGNIITDKQRQLQGLNGMIQSTRTQLGQMLAQEQSLTQQIASIDKQLAAVTVQIQQETAKLELVKLQITDTTQKLIDKQAELQQQIIDFGSRMRVMYKTGPTTGLQLIFSAGNFSDLLNRVIFFADIMREDRRQTNQLTNERNGIRFMKFELESQKADQEKVVKQVQDQKTQLQSLHDQRAAAETQVAAIAAAFQQQLNDMVAQRNAIQAQLQQIVAESLRARSTGKWIWPMDGVITLPFGCTSYPFEIYDPSCPGLHFHTGIDIANDFGTPVHAADAGFVHNYVMTCSWNPRWLCGFGRYVMIVHSGGFVSLYGHLNGFAMPDDAYVAKDTVIGYEGTTGASTGPHLHFEIDVNGTPVDPAIYLPGP